MFSFLRLYFVSLIGKISFIRSGERLFVTLYISVAKIC